MTDDTSPIASPDGDQRGPDFVEAIARGFRVLESFIQEGAQKQRGRLTLTDAARLTDLTRGTTRRLLLTLKAIHYVDSDGKYFWLTPKVLSLSAGFLMPLGLGERSSGILHALTGKLDESASVAILDADEIVYVERVEVRRLFSSRIVSGTRLPASCSSIGRVLLAELPPSLFENWLLRYPPKRLTQHTKTDPAELRAEIEKVRQQKYAIIDEELEIGIRSIAVPIVGRSGRVFAAMNASTSTARHSVDDLHDRFLPELRKAAAELGDTMDW